MSLNKQNLYFFFPYKAIGGVSVLFLRLSNYLSDMNLYNIYLIDYLDGYMSNNYDKNKDINFLEYDVNKDIKFKNNDIVIFQSMPLHVMPTNLIFDNRTKLIYWNLHPYNIFGYTSSIKKYFKNNLIKKIVTILFKYLIYTNDRKAINIFDEKKSIFFMDRENFEQTQKWLNVKLKNQLYLPIIIDSAENIKVDYLSRDEIFNCVWIGRIEDFKAHILVYTLKKLNKIAENYKKDIVFTIIGKGEYLDYLEEQTNSLDNINIKYIDYLDPKHLKEFLIDMDIGFAMGTTALDFAKYGLPTVLLDFTYEKITQDYKFDWLFNTQDFTLGRQITDTLYEKNNTSLEDMIESLEDNYQEISQKSFEFIKNNFDVTINAVNFTALIEKSTLVYDDLNKKYFDMNIFHKLIGAKKYYND